MNEDSFFSLTLHWIPEILKVKNDHVVMIVGSGADSDVENQVHCYLFFFLFLDDHFLV